MEASYDVNIAYTTKGGRDAYPIAILASDTDGKEVSITISISQAKWLRSALKEAIRAEKKLIDD